MGSRLGHHPSLVTGKRWKLLKMPVASIVDWYGPYRSYRRFVSEAHQIATNRCVYMGVGGTADKLRVLYIGLSTRPNTRFANHHALTNPDIKQFFIGEITTSGLPGRRRKKVPTDLDATEHALIAYLSPELNVRRKNTLPEDCVSVFSRFFGRNNWEKPKPTPYFFPPLIAFNTYSGEWHPEQQLN